MGKKITVTESSLWHSRRKEQKHSYWFSNIPLVKNVSLHLETRTALTASPMHVLPHHFQCRLYRNQAIIFWQLYKYFKEQVRILITIDIFGCSGKSLSSFMYLGIWRQKNQLIQTLNKSPPLQNSFIFVAFKLKSSRTLCKMLVN